MDSITVKKEDLIATLRQNREEHRSIFLRAWDVYRAKMIAEIDRAGREARAAQAGEKIIRAFMLPEPEDHTADFDTVIGMMEWEQGDTVRLSQHEFQQYVQNEWGWARSFAANSLSYLAEREE